MMASEKLCLRWNDFERNISEAFREIRDDKDFFDVTLVCEEEHIQAHKIILSACSPFFKKVLLNHNHEHPLIYLMGVKYQDLEAVLNFMYHGEINMAQEELNAFLQVAEDLKIKGLSLGTVSDRSVPIEASKQSLSRPVPKPNSEEDTIQDSEEEELSELPVEKPTKVKKSAKAPKKSASKKKPNSSLSDPNLHDPNSSFSPMPSYEDHDMVELDSIIKLEPFDDPLSPPADTTVDDHNAIVMYNDDAGEEQYGPCEVVVMPEAVDMDNSYGDQYGNGSMILEGQYCCEECNKQFSGPSGLHQHKSSVHKGVSYPCDHCEYKTAQKANLKRHIKNKH